VVAANGRLRCIWWRKRDERRNRMKELTGQTKVSLESVRRTDGGPSGERVGIGEKQSSLLVVTVDRRPSTFTDDVTTNTDRAGLSFSAFPARPVCQAPRQQPAPRHSASYNYSRPINVDVAHTSRITLRTLIPVRTSSHDAHDLYDYTATTRHLRTVCARTITHDTIPLAPLAPLVPLEPHHQTARYMRPPPVNR
jgi:hypothetical protein